MTPSTPQDSQTLTADERVRKIAQAIFSAPTYTVHVGYDEGAGGGNFVYADCVRLDDECFDALRAALNQGQG